MTQGTSGSVVINADDTVTYTPSAGFTGDDSFSYTATSGGVSETTVVAVTVTPASGQNALNFNDYTIGSYAGNQDAGAIASVEDGGATLHITGNGWKQIAFPYQVTANTILEFDFRSPRQGDIHAIGFDSALNLSNQRTFKLYGTQNWGLRNFDNYSTSAPEWQHYRIPVGQFYTGSFAYLFFANDHDVSGANAESYFANVTVYEATSGGHPWRDYGSKQAQQTG